jgi:glycosyltransferase involved in cell wall biosynthesis
VTGDAGYLVNPMDSRLLGGAITGMLVKDELHDRLANLGLARATNFSWIKTATATLEVYQRVAALNG